MEPMTPEQIETLRTLTVEEVMSVYSGTAGRCCCGCAGHHRYSRKLRVSASRDRGYKVEDDEINDGQVRRVLGILQKNIERAEAGSNHFSVELGSRLYVVYPTKHAMQGYVPAEAKANAPSNVARYM
jgi:hypothetical protein